MRVYPISFSFLSNTPVVIALKALNTRSTVSDTEISVNLKSVSNYLPEVPNSLGLTGTHEKFIREGQPGFGCNRVSVYLMFALFAKSQPELISTHEKCILGGHFGYRSIKAYICMIFILSVKSSLSSRINRHSRNVCSWQSIRF